MAKMLKLHIRESIRMVKWQNRQVRENGKIGLNGKMVKPEGAKVVTMLKENIRPMHSSRSIRPILHSQPGHARTSNTCKPREPILSGQSIMPSTSRAPSHSSQYSQPSQPFAALPVLTFLPFSALPVLPLLPSLPIYRS